jgi:flagellar protein FlgJ
MSYEEFVKEFYLKAKAICVKSKISTVGCLAQCAQETGWGEAHPDNIYFGIKPWKKDQDAAEHNTEEVEGGKTKKVKDKFATWKSFEDAVQGYCDFINENKNYKEARQYMDNWRKYLPAVAAGGYATDPNYCASIMWNAKVIERHIYQLGLEA